MPTIENGRGIKAGEMRKWQTMGAVAGLVLSLTASVLMAAERGKIEPLPQDLEVQLALSALPRHLRDNATVYTLNLAKGFEIARKGTDDFHAFVARIGDDAFRGAWPLTEYRSDILYPVAFDRAGSKAQMRVFFDAAEMQANGTPPAALKRIIQERYKSGFYKAPERAGISYMLSPVLRTYTSDTDRVLTINYPHVMYYAPHVSSEDIGAGKLGGTDPFVILHGPHGYMIQALGLAERAAITQEYNEMLQRLCSIKNLWCLPKENYRD
jgi:hypothetical protein